MGAPGWPELAACGMSAPRARMVLTHLSSRSDPPYMRDPVAVAVAVASRSPSSGRPRFVGGAEALLGDAEEVLVAMVITMMGGDMDAAVSTYYVGLVAN